MKSILLLLALIVMPYFCGRAEAFAVRLSHPLTQIIDQSDAIVTAQLVDYIADSTDRLPTGVRTPSGQVAYMGMDAFVIINRLKPEGTYTFKVIQTIKGQSENTLQIDLPRVLADYYGGARLKVEPDNKFLLLLKRDPQNHWVPTDDTLPLIPLTANASDNNVQAAGHEEFIANVQSRVITLMLLGVTEPMIRQSNIYLVRTIVDPQVVKQLAPYLDDTNLDIQDFVLYGLAKNQQISVIPQIVALDKKMGDDGGPMSRGAQSLVTLQHFNAPAALTFINPLLFDTYRNIRVSAILGLQNHSDSSSIPYLLLSVNQKFIGTTANKILCKLTLDTEKNNIDTIDLNHQDEKKQFIAWWQDELAGKHPADADDKPAVTLRETQHFEATDLPQLNQGLFMRSEFTRQAAIRGLQQFADASSIPYLLIALYDPQPEIAYGAYTILHRLVPDLGAATPTKWKSEREAQTKLAFDWWQKHLLDAEKN